MKAVTTVSALRQELAIHKGKKVGFVPTMGALHEGHISLVTRARKECDIVVASVFVNPTQFNDKNDLKNYPRTPEADAEMLAAAGVDVVLFPSVEEIYPEPDTRVFDFGLIDKKGRLLNNPVHYRDTRTVGMIEKVCEIIPKEELYGRTGIQFASLNTIFQLAALKEKLNAILR